MLPTHGRYGYSAIVRRPPYDWPNGARLAFYIAVNVEQFPFGEGLGPDLNPKQPEPDVVNFTWRDWGNRVGVWRLIEALDEHRLPACALLNTEIYDHCPDVAAAFRARGDEFVAHGRTNAERQADMDEAAERAMIAGCTERIAHEEGARPLGWMGPHVNETRVTPDLLAEVGYRYVMDWAMDDQPVWLATRAGRLLAIPYSRPMNDLPMLHRANTPPALWADAVIDAFEEMLEQSSRQPLVMNLSLHPYLLGQPHRLRHLRRLLTHIAARRERLWLARPGEIWRHVSTLPDGVVPC